MTPSAYDFFLKERQRVPSWITAFLPSSDAPPAPSEIVDRLSSLPLVETRTPEDPEIAESEWEVEADFRFEREGPLTRARLWAAPSDYFETAHADWLGVTKADQAAAKESRFYVGVSTTFGDNPLRDFHRQVRILEAAAPDAVMVMDLAACRPHPPGWLKEVSSSSVPPSPQNLYVIHSVYEKDDPRAAVWMHTHGLRRCGSIELEIMGVTSAQAPPLARLINTVAAMFVEQGPCPPDTPFEGGRRLNLAWLPWEDGIRRVKKPSLGGQDDRDPAHSLPSGILFVPRWGLFGRRYASPARHVPTLEANPLLYVSRMETDRMALLAQDRLGEFADLQRRFGHSPDWMFLVKLGYPIDGAPSEGDREHMWFQVHGIRGNAVDATLTNEPYGVARLKKGDRGTHPLDLLSDWAVLNPSGQYTPDTLHLLRRKIAASPAPDGPDVPS
jgi:hypothetical protein